MAGSDRHLNSGYPSNSARLYGLLHLLLQKSNDALHLADVPPFRPDWLFAFVFHCPLRQTRGEEVSEVHLNRLFPIVDLFLP
jgi:hypothetical protein